MGSIFLPYGIFANSICVIFGGLLGCLLKDRIPDRLRESLPVVFGIVSLTMGITAIMNVHLLPAVALATILGYILGELLQLESGLYRAVDKAVKRAGSKANHQIDMDTLIGVIVLFCASGTGIYGAMEARLTDNHTILYTKSLLDFFSSGLFAALMGVIICYIAVPKFIVLYLLYLSAGFILPYATPEMIMDFKACGGVIMFATGLRIGKIKSVSIVNMLPAFVLIMPVSYLCDLIM